MASEFPAKLTTKVDAVTEFPATMAATKVDAATEFPATIATKEAQFRRAQARLVAMFRISPCSPTTWILGFIGVISTCFTLFKFPLNHQILIAFAVGSAIGTFLNLFIIFMHYVLSINVLSINGRKLNNNTHGRKMIEKCDKLMTAILITEVYGFSSGAFFWVYFVMLTVLNTFLPYHDDPPICSTGLIHYFLTAAGSWFLSWLFLKPISSSAVSRVAELKV